MTEREWDACSDFSEMLSACKDKVSDRKYLLFAAACCRESWHLLGDERSRLAVLTCESFADGLVSSAEMEAVLAMAQMVLHDRAVNMPTEPERWAAARAASALFDGAEYAARGASAWVGNGKMWRVVEEWRRQTGVEIRYAPDGAYGRARKKERCPMRRCKLRRPTGQTYFGTLYPTHSGHCAAST
jgi:hypothetical protein